MGNVGKKDSEMRTWALSIIIVLAGQALAGRSAVAGGEPGKQADEIIKASGIKAGLCVHLGATDGKLTGALGRKLGGGEAAFIVQGLAADAATLKKAREYIQSQGLYGNASVVRCDFKRLPYAENLVNLVVAHDLPALLGGGLDLKEVVRVLAPNGVLCFGGKLDAGKLTAAGFTDVKTAGAWTAALKPRPKEMDDWPSYNHGPDQNPVSQDRLVSEGMPARLRWFNGSPWWFRDQALGWVSAGGRLFFVPKYGAPGAWASNPSQKQALIALDAYNGLLLWKRPLARRRRGTPRFVAAADRVYVPIDEDGILAALDAATGKAVRTYKEAGRVAGFILHEGKLFTQVYGGKLNTAIDAETGEVLWKNDTVGVGLIAEGRGFGMGYERNKPDKLTCLDLVTGKIQWQVPLADPSDKHSRPPWLYYQGVLVFTHIIPRIKGKSDQKSWLTAYSPKDGRQLWEYRPDDVKYVPSSRKGFVFGARGLLWTYLRLARKNASGTWHAFAGLDPATGKEKVRRDYPFKPVEGHYRCCRHVATERFFIGGTYEFFDWETGTIFTWNAIRTGCGAMGILPANGLVYTPDRHCGCRNFMQRGFAATAPPGKLEEGTADRLEKGPAYGAKAPNPQSSSAEATEDRSAIRNPKSDWPIYRHDPRRSGATRGAVPGELKPLWEGQAGRGLTAPTIAEGKVFVASMDEHRVWALEADTGESRWTFTAGGPVDTPPTIHAGLAVFGCRDGYVYCLRAKDGELLWRFRATPANEQIIVDGRVESAWRVHGSVLVLGETTYFAAGWHSAVEGGLTLYAVKLESGELIWKRRYDKPERTSPGLLRRTGFPARLLRSDGRTIFMKGNSSSFDRRNGERVPRRPAGRIVSFGVSGFLDRCWWSWENIAAIWSDGRVRAKMLVSDREISCAIFPQWPVGRSGWSREFPGLGLFALCGKKSGSKTTQMDWAVPVPSIRMKAMALAGGTVFVAGRTDEIPELRELAERIRKYKSTNTWKQLHYSKVYSEFVKVAAELPEEKLFPKDGRLMAFSTADGKKLGEVKLPAPPVFDGLAAAHGKLYLSCLDGKVRCFGKK